MSVTVSNQGIRQNFPVNGSFLSFFVLGKIIHVWDFFLLQIIHVHLLVDIFYYYFRADQHLPSSESLRTGADSSN